MTLLEKLKPSYLAYAQTKIYKEKINKTIKFISEVLEKHNNPYVAFSTGKDSLCMLSMIYNISPKVKVMFHDSGVELPESYNQIKKICDFWDLNLNIINSPVNVLEIYKSKNGIFQGNCEDIAFTSAMMNPIRNWVKENSHDLSFIGLRKEESSRRRKMLNTFGNYFYCKSNSIYECFPLSNWKGEDIWAYIFSNNILENFIHPAYYKDRLVEDPAKIRVSWFCDPAMATRGSFLWLKIYYPEIWNMLINMFPEMKSYY